jgi:glucan phosphorylase
MNKGKSQDKRIFIFAGHALDLDKARYSSRELANFILQIGRKLEYCSVNTRVIFIPNLSVSQVTELALVPAIDVFEALSFDDYSRSATLASMEELQYMKCALNGALLLGPDSRSNVELH